MDRRFRMAVKQEIEAWIVAYSIPDEHANPQIVKVLTNALNRIEELEREEKHDSNQINPRLMDMPL